MTARRPLKVAVVGLWKKQFEEVRLACRGLGVDLVHVEKDQAAFKVPAADRFVLTSSFIDHRVQDRLLAAIDRGRLEIVRGGKAGVVRRIKEILGVGPEERERGCHHEDEL